MIISTLSFLIFLFSVVYLPSVTLFTRILKIKFENSAAQTIFVLVFGVVLVILFGLAIGLLGLPLKVIYILPALAIIARPKLRLDKQALSIYAFLMAIALVQSYPLFRGGLSSSSGLVFPSVHDNLWNIAIINELSKNIPPLNPSISGFVLKNHHYLYHYFLTIAAKITGINIFDLYFRLGPVFVSFLFAGSLYLVSAIFTANSLFRLLAVILGVFSGNFAYLAPLFTSHISDWRGNLFFADQPFDQIFNPYSVLGFALFLTSIYSFYKYLTAKHFSTSWLITSSLLIGISFGVKSFAGIILMVAISILALISFFFKNQRIIILTLTSWLVFLSVFYLIAAPKGVSLVFAPGWLLTEMMVGEDKLNLPQFSDMENFYRQTGNLPGFLKIKSIELLIYLIGNLGIRLLGFIFLCKLFFGSNKKRIPLFFSIYLLLLINISLFLPLLFNLSTSPHNIIQFTPYSLVLLAVLTAYFLEGKSIILIIFILILALPVNVKNFAQKLREGGDVIDRNELAALEYLKKEMPDDSLLLINPRQFGQNPIYIPALTAKKVYLADPGYAGQTGVNPGQRLIKIDNFWKSDLTDKDFLIKENIKFIYLLKIRNEKLINETGLISGKMYSVALDNQKVLLLRFNK